MDKVGYFIFIFAYDRPSEPKDFIVAIYNPQVELPRP